MSDKDDREMHRIYKGISDYCKTYNIPKENLLDILEDSESPADDQR